MGKVEGIALNDDAMCKLLDCLSESHPEIISLWNLLMAYNEPLAEAFWKMIQIQFRSDGAEMDSFYPDFVGLLKEAARQCAVALGNLRREIVTDDPRYVSRDALELLDMALSDGYHGQ